VLFKPLTREELGKIADIQLNDLQKRLQENRIPLEVSAAVKTYIATNGYDPVYGARPMKRLIQQKIETPIARALLAGARPEGSVLNVDLVDGVIFVKFVEPKKPEGVKPRKTARA
jgi:ATP-dependent Clp protease ATP-binding subunit ClpB